MCRVIFPIKNYFKKLSLKNDVQIVHNVQLSELNHSGNKTERVLISMAYELCIFCITIQKFFSSVLQI